MNDRDRLKVLEKLCQDHIKAMVEKASENGGALGEGLNLAAMELAKALVGEGFSVLAARSCIHHEDCDEADRRARSKGWQGAVHQ